MKMPNVSMYLNYKMSFFLLRQKKNHAIAIPYFILFVFCMGWKIGWTSVIKWGQSGKDMKEMVHFIVLKGL
jgi:hypothetical protein